MKSIFFNFFELIIAKDEFKYHYLYFNSKEQLYSLREEYPEIDFIHSNDKIYFNFGNKGSVNKISELSDCILRVDTDPYIILKSLSRILLSTFWQAQDKVKIQYKKGGIIKITLLEKDLSNGKFKGLNIFQNFNLHFIPICHNSTIKLGFTVLSSLSPKIIWEIEDFIEHNIEIEESEVNDRTGQILSKQSTINKLLKHYGCQENYKKEVDYLSSIQNELKNILSFVENYLKIPNSDIKELKYSIISLDEDNSVFPAKIIKKPESYFYKGNYPNRENSFQQRHKIKFNKPFSFDQFENRIIYLKILVPNNKHLAVSRFFKDIESELIETFKIRKENLKYEVIRLDDFNLQAYIKARRQVVGATDLVIIIIDESHESLPIASSPYFYCKAKFLEQGLNTQEVQKQQIEKYLSDKGLGKPNYTNHNLALNIYAKLGGLGWTVKPKDTNDELVIGIGATTDKDGQPILGLMNIFNGNGKYIYGKVASVTSMEDYQEMLERTLSNNIKEYISAGILDSSKSFRIIFHIFKPAGKNNEIKSLMNVIDKLSSYSFEYAFIHIGAGHNYRFFTYEGNLSNPKFILKGNNSINERGTSIKMNSSLGFICLSQMSSTFIKVQVDNRSSFKSFDIDYLINQVYQFTELSHTSYNKAGKPVTIRYPGLMARLTEQLKEISGFDLNEIDSPDNSLWFI